MSNGEHRARQILENLDRIATLKQDPRCLLNFASTTYSQNGEDGMIAEVLRRLMISDPTFLEIGASDGRENCTRALAEQGCRGIWVEADPNLCEQATQVVRGRNVEVIQKFVSLTNIDEIIDWCLETIGDPTLLVIDTDGNDWWILQRILRRVEPQLVVAEYNPTFGPKSRWIMPYDDKHQWKNDNVYGASLKSYDIMLRKFGFRLIACDPDGVNAFWVPKGHVNLFSDQTTSESKFIEPRLSMVHPSRDDEYVDWELSLEDINSIHIGSVTIHRSSTSQSKVAAIEINNLSAKSISSFGQFPIRAGLTLRDAEYEEPVRATINGTISPFSTGYAYAIFSANDIPLSVRLVQEGKRWWDEYLALTNGF